MLKRWLVAANENTTAEKVEEDFPKMIEDLKYQLIKENLVKSNNLKVEDADIEAFGKTCGTGSVCTVRYAFRSGRCIGELC